MKINLSFLFLYVGLFLVFPLNMVAQSKVDSLNYYYNLALHPKDETSLAAAYTFFTKHKQACLAKKYPEGAIHDLGLLSIIQKESGYYHDSETSSIEALDLLKTLKDSDYKRASQLTLYNQLGRTSRALMEYDRALRYYDQAEALAETPEHLNIIRYNRALIYLDQGKAEKALPEFKKAYEVSLQIGDPNEVARCLDNMGYAQSHLDHPEALQNLQKALEMRLELEDLDGTYASYKHLSQHYTRQNDPQAAHDYLLKANEVAHRLNSDSFKLDALSALVDLTPDSLVQEYKLLSDQKRRDNLLAENKYTSKKYDYTQKELEAQRSELETERTQMLVLLVVVLSVFTIWVLRFRHKRANIQKVFDTETRISKKIHDELANDVSDLMGFVQHDLQTSEPQKTQLLNVLEDVYIRTRDISTETASIDFDNFPESLKHLLIQHQTANVKVLINDVNTIDWTRIHRHKKLAVYRCLQELMVNMKKHSQARLVSIVFKKHAGSHEIRYTDDGKGFNLAKINVRGLTNAESRMKEIGGSFTFETSEGHGVKATLIF